MSSLSPRPEVLQRNLSSNANRLFTGKSVKKLLIFVLLQLQDNDRTASGASIGYREQRDALQGLSADTYRIMNRTGEPIPANCRLKAGSEVSQHIYIRRDGSRLEEATLQEHDFTYIFRETIYSVMADNGDKLTLSTFASLGNSRLRICDELGSSPPDGVSLQDLPTRRELDVITSEDHGFYIHHHFGQSSAYESVRNRGYFLAHNHDRGVFLKYSASSDRAAYDLELRFTVESP